MYNKKIIRKELKVEERGVIVGMRKIGHSFSEISSFTSMPLSTVKGVFYCYSNHAKAKSFKKSGRPPILLERDNRALKLIKENRRTTLSQIQLSWPTKLSIRIIRRMTHKLGLRNCIPRKKQKRKTQLGSRKKKLGCGRVEKNHLDRRIIGRNRKKLHCS